MAKGRGVALSSGAQGVPACHWVHAETEEWMLTSDTPIGPAMLTAGVLEAELPGRLGCYVYPRDVVLSFKGAKHMTTAHMQALFKREAAPVNGVTPRVRSRPEIHHVDIPPLPVEEEVAAAPPSDDEGDEDGVQHCEDVPEEDKPPWEEEESDEEVDDLAALKLHVS